MSQTPTQRSREIDAARRRNINSTLERLARDQPARRKLADQLSAALGVLSGDELEIAERLVAAINLVWMRDGNRSVGANVLLSISAIVSRLLRGRASYGELTIGSDPRDWALERDEELADAVVYDSISAVEIERATGDRDDHNTVVQDHLAALINVGAHVQHSTLAARIQTVLDRERPTPFTIPPPWCLGSALLFAHGAVRIANNTIVAVRCHQCEREWSLASTELRLTGSGQYVIPTHKSERTDWTTLPPEEPTR